MGVLDTMRWATGKIAGICTTLKKDGPVKIGEIYTTVKNDGPEKAKEIMAGIAQALPDEILKIVPGGKPVRKVMRKIRSSGTSSGELKEMRQRISGLECEMKEMGKRISLCESEISCLREEKMEWQQDRIMLMASMLALATHAETNSWQTLTLLLTMNDPSPL